MALPLCVEAIPLTTNTFTETETATETATETVTPSPTLTSSETGTETVTTSPSETLTPSVTLTSSETLTPSQTYTPLPSVDNARVYPNVVTSFQAGSSFVMVDRIPATATVSIYNLHWELVNSFSSADIISNSVKWFFQNKSGGTVSSGIYLCVITDGGSRSIRRIVLVR